MISAEEFLRRHPVASPEPGAPRNPAADAPGIEVADIPIDASADDAPSDDGSARSFRRRASGPSRWRNGAQVEDPADVDACRESALHLLDAAARSSGALRDRLLDRGYDADVVERVMLRLEELRLIDDRGYAESVVRSCVSRMMGRRGAAAELSRRGVDRAVAAQVVDEAERAGAFEDAAWELGRSVARRTHGLDRQVRQRRFWSAGGRKGHDPETLRRIARELLD
ncbi:RecX family transcriptional regulator [Bifidobacterium sp. MA2]|uniref:Regulatory protein RecX n=1 Tax=Bifidobacterium santillanense TaxID=2809028 RepID=A0ABS5UMN1_9BIFI|nr:regulatory protein RecX [Bifidobacterium santillanense]MBT1172139.1 RecX family transcriptional regulator [Bifidobacterium santillanense]